MTWLMSGNVLLGAYECATYKNSTASFAKEGRMKELLLGGMDLCAHLCVSTPRDRTPVGWEWEDKYDWQLHHKCHWRDVSLRRCLFSKTCFLLQYILILRIAWREKKMYFIYFKIFPLCEGVQCASRGGSQEEGRSSLWQINGYRTFFISRCVAKFSVLNTSFGGLQKTHNFLAASVSRILCDSKVGWQSHRCGASCRHQTTQLAPLTICHRMRKTGIIVVRFKYFIIVTGSEHTNTVLRTFDKSYFLSLPWPLVVLTSQLPPLRMWRLILVMQQAEVVW